MHGSYGITKLNEEAVRNHEAIVRLNKEYAEAVAKRAEERKIGAGSGGVHGTDPQPA